jgi:hypothetical protein
MSEQQIESSTNGATPPETEIEEVKAEEKPKKAKKKAKVEKKAAKAKTEKKVVAKKATKKAAKPKAEKKAKKVVAGGPKHNYPSAESTPAERKAAAERTAAFMKASAKREEPNNDEEKVWKSIKVGTETDTATLAELFSGNSAKRRSRVRNALRWLRASKKFKSTSKGCYKRVA